MSWAKGNPESSFRESNLCLVVLDLLGAGIVTSSVTLTWGLLLTILNPGVQSKPDWGWNERRIETHSLRLLGSLVAPSNG